jgi:hypothetical protein
MYSSAAPVYSIPLRRSVVANDGTAAAHLGNKGGGDKHGGEVTVALHDRPSAS